MKHLLMFASICMLPIIGFSQNNTVASGGNASGANGTVSFTVGQIDYTNATGTDGSSHEGVQQPFDFFDPNASTSEEEWQVSLYPNPTNDKVIIQFENLLNNAKYSLFDAQGKELLSGAILSQQVTLDVSSFSAGSYFLEMNSSSKSTTTIQIIKH